MGQEIHPIPYHGIFQKIKLSHGMGWDEIVPSHSVDNQKFSKSTMIEE